MSQQKSRMHTLQYVPVWGHSSQFQMAKSRIQSLMTCLKKYILNQKMFLQDKK